MRSFNTLSFLATVFFNSSMVSFRLTAIVKGPPVNGAMVTAIKSGLASPPRLGRGKFGGVEVDELGGAEEAAPPTG